MTNIVPLFPKPKRKRGYRRRVWHSYYSHQQDWLFNWKRELGWALSAIAQMPMNGVTGEYDLPFHAAIADITIRSFKVGHQVYFLVAIAELDSLPLYVVGKHSENCMDAVLIAYAANHHDMGVSKSYHCYLSGHGGIDASQYFSTKKDTIAWLRRKAKEYERFFHK